MNLRVMSALALLLPASFALAQDRVKIPVPGRATVLDADLYGTGTKYVILAHGGRFGKESWRKQAQVLASSGFVALAIRFRGDSQGSDGALNSQGSPAENAEDVIAAAKYLGSKGGIDIAAVGASFGGDAVGDANAQSPPGTISRMVFLGSAGGSAPERLSGRKLFIVAHDDSNAWGPRLPDIQLHFERAREPKKLVVVHGSAHAQFLFETDQGNLVLNRILSFLLEP